ncbi:hypothetical protein DL93DRAFT_2188818 [Clavulina sp. PMI_390]|nr:hypothetical protein DL93DRAFT_2188818 [Clavulina sp. PMI_390]
MVNQGVSPDHLEELTISNYLIGIYYLMVADRIKAAVHKRQCNKFEEEGSKDIRSKGGRHTAATVLSEKASPTAVTLVSLSKSLEVHDGWTKPKSATMSFEIHSSVPVSSDPRHTTPFAHRDLEHVSHCVDESPSLSEASILSIEGYRQRAGVVVHRFVVIELAREEQHNVWLRLDRRLERGISSWNLIKASGATKANDRASLSGSKERLVSDATYENSRVLDRPPRLADLSRLLRIINEELQTYSIWPHLAAAQDGWFVHATRNVRHIEMGNTVRSNVFARYWDGNHPARRDSAVPPPLPPKTQPTLMKESSYFTPKSDSTIEAIETSAFAQSDDEYTALEFNLASLHLQEGTRRAAEPPPPSLRPAFPPPRSEQRPGNLLPQSAYPSTKAREAMKKPRSTTHNAPLPPYSPPRTHGSPSVTGNRFGDEKDRKVGVSLLRTLNMIERLEWLLPQTQKLLTQAQKYAKDVYLSYHPSEHRPADPALRSKLQQFSETLYELCCTILDSAPSDAVLDVVRHARRIALRAYEGNALSTELAKLFRTEGSILYDAQRYDEAINALRQSYQLYHQLDPLSNVTILKGLIYSLSILSWTNLKQGDPTSALKYTHRAVYWAEEGNRRFGSTPDEPWHASLLPDALATLTQAYCALGQFENALMYGRRAAQLAREVFRSYEEDQTADTFGYALEWYEQALIGASLYGSDDFDQSCSPREWRAMRGQLDQSCNSYTYVVQKVDALNAALDQILYPRRQL